MTKIVFRIQLRDNKETLVETYPLFNIPTIIRGIFVGRVSMSSTATNATIILSPSNRIDTATYLFKVFEFNGKTDEEPLQIIVQCKYKLSEL